MIALKPEIVFNPYLEISRHGENNFALSYSNSNVVLEMSYDSNDTGIRLEIEFMYVVMLDIASFPGANTINVEYDKLMLGSLVEFSASEYRDEWQKHFEYRTKFKHYNILLLNSNKNINVICESIKIERL